MKRRNNAVSGTLLAGLDPHHLATRQSRAPSKRPRITTPVPTRHRFEQARAELPPRRGEVTRYFPHKIKECSSPHGDRLREQALPLLRIWRL